MSVFCFDGGEFVVFGSRVRSLLCIWSRRLRLPVLFLLIEVTQLSCVALRKKKVSLLAGFTNHHFNCMCGIKNVFRCSDLLV